MNWMNYEGRAAWWALRATWRYLTGHLRLEVALIFGLPLAVSIITRQSDWAKQQVGDAGVAAEVVVGVAALAVLVCILLTALLVNLVLAPSKMEKDRDAVWDEIQRKLGLERDSLVDRVRQLRQEPLRPDILQHHRELLDAFAEVGNVNLLTHAGRELTNWVRSEGENISIPGGTVRIVGNGEFEAHLHAERFTQWELLRQHISEDPIWEQVDDWNHSVVEELSARRNLLHAIGGFMTDTLRLPISQQRVDHAGEEAIHPFFLDHMFEEVFSRAVGMVATQRTEEDFPIHGRAVQGPGGHLFLLTDDAHKRGMAVQLALSMPDSLSDTPAYLAVANSYGLAKGARDALHSAVGKLLARPHLPRMSRCESCAID